MTKLTTERLEKFVNDIKTDGMCDITDHQVESALIQLLAYEQAAKNPVAWVATDSEGFPEYNGHNEFSADCGAGTPLYAAPVLPKQPELVENLKKVMNSWLAMEPKLAYQPEFTDVMMLLDAEAAHAQPVIPEGLLQAINRLLDNDGSRGKFSAVQSYDAREDLERLLAPTAQPVSEPYKLPSGYALVPCKLTAENGAKSCMSGEFTEQTEISCPECFGDDECETCDGSGMIEVTVPVSWTTIKDIWVKGIEHFAAAPAQEQK